MISIDSFLPYKIDSEEILDNRTIKALERQEIYTIKDLLLFLENNSVHEIKWLGKKSISKINIFLSILKNKNIELDHKDNGENKDLSIQSDIQDTPLNLFSSFLSLRTINSLEEIWIYSTKQLLKNRFYDFKSTKWIGKKWIKEIEYFINHIINNFSISKVTQNKVDIGISEIIKDQRIIQILWFNWINNLTDLGEYIKDKKDTQKLRYLDNEDLKVIIDSYNNIFREENKKETFAEFFFWILDNLKEEEKIILNDRILWNLTLVQVWAKLSLTRERVRQKQKNIEKIIQDNSDLFIKQNEDLLIKIQNNIKLHNYIFLPNEISIFDYLWFIEKDSNLLYFFLKWIKWLKWEIIDNKIYCILNHDNILISEDLTNIYVYVIKRLRNNNEDILLEDIFYELILEKILSKKIDYINFKEEIINYLKKIVELHDDYVINIDVIHRFKKKYKLEDYVEMILEKNLDWLHFSAINKEIREIYNLEYTDIQVHNVLWRSWSNFINIWRWLYTLKTNSDYSWEKTWDIIYLYLKEIWLPKTLKEITDHVLSRKKINEWTVIAAIGWYKNENRFVFYNDWKIGLKEWWLWNVREKREVTNYELSIKKAYNILLDKNLIPNSFSSKDLIELLFKNFWDKISQNSWSIYTLLQKLEKKWNLKVTFDWNKNIYSLIK